MYWAYGTAWPLLFELTFMLGILEGEKQSLPCLFSIMPNVSGLSSLEARERLHRDGYNELPHAPRPSYVSVFIDQFRNPLIYLLLIAGVFIYLLGSGHDALIITGVLLLNAIVGTFQEGRARSIIERLARFDNPTTTVMRDGKPTIIAVREVVVGDVCLIQEGERIPADARIIKNEQLLVDESILTGESVRVSKKEGDMLFRGTMVMGGSAMAEVIATGSRTEFGKIGKSIANLDVDMPLKRELDRLSHTIVIGVLALCAALFIIGMLWGKTFTQLLVMLTALFICVVPEGLQLVFTIVLVSGAYRLARHNVLVRRMQAVEGLGRTDLIILDKTGTLTRNQMMVTTVVTPEDIFEVTGAGYDPEGTITARNKTSQDFLKNLAERALLFDGSHSSGDPRTADFTLKGDPLDAALGVFAQKAGVEKDAVFHKYRIIEQQPFDPEKRTRTLVVEYGDTRETLILGSPEAFDAEKIFPVQMQQLLENGARSIALATDGKLIALFGIEDALRPEVRPMVEDARDAGLAIIMATGDHPRTAEHIAERSGIFRAGDTIMMGDEISHHNSHFKTTTVFARVKPQQKLELVQLYQHEHKIVAMTGDGVNDVPSLVAADLGIAMGKSGSDVAHEIADIVLLDDSFASIIRAIEEGRHIFYTLRRVILYFFTTNLGEVFVVLWALLVNWPLPIVAAQILWLNLVTDGFLDIALAMEPREKNLLHAHWLQRAQKGGLIDRSMAIRITIMALVMAIGTLFLFHQYLPDLAKARTMTLVGMAMFQWWNAWNCRSEKISIFKLGLFSNGWLLLATAGVLFLQITVVYTPFLQKIFSTVALNIQDWILIFGVSVTIIGVEELRKLWYSNPN